MLAESGAKSSTCFKLLRNFCAAQTYSSGLHFVLISGCATKQSSLCMSALGANDICPENLSEIRSCSRKEASDCTSRAIPAHGIKEIPLLILPAD